MRNYILWILVSISLVFAVSGCASTDPYETREVSEKKKPSKPKKPQSPPPSYPSC